MSITLSIYGYTVSSGIIIWCGVAFTRASAEIFVEGKGWKAQKWSFIRAKKGPKNNEKVAKKAPT